MAATSPAVDTLTIDLRQLYIAIQKQPQLKRKIIVEWYERTLNESSVERAELGMLLLGILDARDEMSSGPITVNITNSTVGNFNLGQQVGIIKATVESLSSNGSSSDQQLAEALKTMTEAIVGSKEMNDAEKHQATQVLAQVAEQAQKPPGERSIGTIKAMMLGFPGLISTASHLTKLWEHWGPQIKTFFGL